MAEKRAFPKAKSDHVFGPARKPAKMLRTGIYAAPVVGSLGVVAGGLADHTTEPANGLWIWHGCC